MTFVDPTPFGGGVNGRPRLRVSDESTGPTVQRELSTADGASTPEFDLGTVGEAFASSESRRVDVFVRSLLPPLSARHRQERLIRRLKSMAEQSQIEEVSVHVTGDRICLCETCRETDTGATLLDRLGELDDWGADDAAFSPFLETRELSSAVTDDHARALVPPRVTVALYCDDSLSGVFPCHAGDRTYCVGDFIDALDRVTDTGTPAADPQSRQRSSGR